MSLKPMDSTVESHALVTHGKRQRVDWFRAPVTDYSNVSTLVWPKGPRATLAELDTSNDLVDVFYYKAHSQTFLRDTRQSDKCIIELQVDSDELQLDATVNSSTFESFTVHSKSLIDAIRPALTSVNCPIPDHVVDQHTFREPFRSLFFAQARLLETLKHAGLGSTKEKQMRAFISVLQVIMRRLNQKVQDLGSKKMVEFDIAWTLYPLGSYAVFDTRGITHIAQVVANEPEFVKAQRYHWLRLAAYDFDGSNFGFLEDTFNLMDIIGNATSLSSLVHRPLWYEERYGDSSIVKTAVAKGRKLLNYQTYRMCNFSGKTLPLPENAGGVEIRGRVIVDHLGARKAGFCRVGFWGYTEHIIMPISLQRADVYNEMRTLFQNDKSRRPTPEEAEKRVKFFSHHEEFLMLLRTDISAFSLECNSWFSLDFANLKPVVFPERPMSGLVGSASKQFGFLNMLVDRKLSLSKQNPTVSGSTHEDQPLLVLFSGATGTGKTSTVNAIAELHQRPLMTLKLPVMKGNRSPVDPDYAGFFADATAWQAIVLIDDAYSLLGIPKHDFFIHPEQRSERLLTHIRRFQGVVFLVKRDDQQLVHTALKHVQMYHEFPAFDASKRLKIWTKLLKPGGDSTSLSSMGDELIKELSSWDLNGHQISHLHRTLQMLYGCDSGGEITLTDLEQLRDLTVLPKKEWEPPVEPKDEKPKE